MNYILFGDQSRIHLLPFTYMRPLADIRVGILSLREKWETYLRTKTSSLTEEYLSRKYPMHKEDDNILINSRVFPNADLIKELGKLKPNQTLISGELLIAHRLRAQDIDNLDAELLDAVEPMETKADLTTLNLLMDIVNLNGQAIRDDFALLTKGKKSHDIPSHVQVNTPENVFVEEGATFGFCFINASEGPVYIDKGATVMDGAMLRGPLSIGKGSVIKMGAKVYGNTTIGPNCKIGGEVVRSVVFGNSNKPHDGFLGHSVLGEWCNLGSDTNTSNLKNNYEEVRLWDYAEKSFVRTGSQFCGTFMGDHSKCGINTMFNTGTVIGVNAQIFGAGFMRNFIPSFSWGSVSGFSTVDIDKAVETARRVYARRNKTFDPVEEHILRYVFEHTFHYRKI